MYPIASLVNPYNFEAVMLCRLYGLPDNIKFSIDWLPLIDSCVNSHIMNWATILSENLAKAINEYRQIRDSSSKPVPQFFTSAYILDAIYFSTNFSIMGWKWTPEDPTPIHLSHKEIWEHNYAPHFHRLCYGVVLLV